MDYPSLLTTERLRELIHAALTLWHKGNADGSPLEGFLLYQRAYADQRSVRRATNQLLGKLLDQLAEQIPEEATIVRLRFPEDEG